MIALSFVSSISGSPASYDPPLLGADEPGPYELLNPKGTAKCLLICDHASNRVPTKLDNLGLSDEALQMHMAWDIGAGHIIRRLSEILDAPAILGTYSRLVIDLNRRLDHPTAFVTSSEGRSIPGNVAMGDEDRALRIKELYEPFHAEIGRVLDDFAARDIVPAVISVHSFTKQFYKLTRPWEIGVLWTRDERMPVPVMSYFRQKGYNVGDNQPYDSRLLRGTTVDRHADGRRLPNVLIEMRNDLVAREQDCDKWAEMLGNCFKNLLQEEMIHRYYDGPDVPCDPEAERRYFEQLIKMAKRGE